MTRELHVISNVQPVLDYVHHGVRVSVGPEDGDQLHATVGEAHDAPGVREGTSTLQFPPPPGGWVVARTVAPGVSIVDSVVTEIDSAQGSPESRIAVDVTSELTREEIETIADAMASKSDAECIVAIRIVGT